MPVVKKTAAPKKKSPAKKTPKSPVKKTAKKPEKKQSKPVKPVKKAKPEKKPAKKAAKKPIKKPAPEVTTTALEHRKTQKNTENSPQIYYEIIDFCDVDLTPKQRDFLAYYLMPGQPCHFNAFKAAVNAGYAPSTAKGDIYRFLSRPEVQKILRMNEALEHQEKHENAKRAKEVKTLRAFFDPIDFYVKKTETKYTRDGEEYEVSVMALKDMEDMTEEQRLCIDGVESKGQSSIQTYKMPDREKALDDLIKEDKELSKSLDDAGEEETREIIIERITVRETKRAELPPELEYEIVESGTETEDEDEDEDV